MRLELAVTIEIGEAGGYRSAIEPSQPAGRQASGPLVFEPIAGGWRGVVTIDGTSDACDIDLGIHLHALIDLSREHPSWQISIAIEPDGGVLELRAGAFSETDAQLQGILALASQAQALKGSERGFERIYASMRLPADAHQHFVDLVLKQVPPEWDAPVTEPSPDAVAIGFELRRDPERTAQVISILRMAWLNEGSGASCLVEVEGPSPVVQVVDSLRGWSDLERATRSVEIVHTILRAPRKPRAAASRKAVSRGPEIPALGARTLTWIDEQDRIRGLTRDGTIWDLSERTELAIADANRSARPPGFVRHRNGSFAYHGKELPKPAEGTTRLAHFVVAHEVLITDTQGDHAQVSFVSDRGFVQGPILRHPVNIVSSGALAFAVADVGDFAALVTIEPGGAGWDYRTPWPATARITDLAVASAGSLIVVGDGVAYQVDAFTGELQRTLYLPCEDPAIVRCSPTTAWITGRSPGAGHRYDLFGIELQDGRVTVETAAIRSEGWGELTAVRSDTRWLLAFARRGVLALEEHAVEPLLSIETDAAIAQLHQWDTLTAAFAETAGATQISVGERELETVSVPGSVRWPLVESK